MNNHSRKLRARPALECLEDRFVLSAGLSPKHNLVIDCGNGDDVVDVRNVTTSKGVTSIQVTENSTVTLFNVEDVSGGLVFFYGNDGNDHFTNTSTLVAEAYGGDGNDVLNSVRTHTLDGEDGNDTLTTGF